MNKITPQDQWILQKERIIAWLRLGFAVIAIAVVQLNPSRLARFPLLSYISLGSFLIYSLAILYYVYVVHQKAHSKRIGLIASCLDMVWVSLIVLSTGGTSTPFFAYYFFPIITASSRYGIKGGVSAAVAGVAIYGFIRFHFDWDAFLGIDRFAVRSIYLIVLAYMFGLLSEFENKQNQKLVALSKTTGELARREERRRISQELHDGLLQSLATHIVRLETCRKQFPQLLPEVDRELKSIENDARSAMKTIRQFLGGQDTQPFPPGMLAEQLRDELTFMRDGLGMRLIFETEPEDLDLPDERAGEAVPDREDAAVVVHRGRRDMVTAVEARGDEDGFDPAKVDPEVAVVAHAVEGSDGDRGRDDRQASRRVALVGSGDVRQPGGRFCPRRATFRAPQGL